MTIELTPLPKQNTTVSDRLTMGDAEAGLIAANVTALNSRRHKEGIL